MAEKDYKNALPIGTILKSPMHSYRIEEVLGAGGFGITYKVSSKIMAGNIPVRTYFAIKEYFINSFCMRNDSHAIVVTEALEGQFQDTKKGFLSEARRLNGLSGKHKGVVRVNEVFEANHTIYYVMQFLEGKNLRTLVNEQGPMTEQQALSLINQVGEAVDFLHQSRITHLDIKPDNILLTKTDDDETEPHPVLIDFGLAKHYDEDGNPTSTINVAGCSPGFAPMEQYVQITTFSPTADVYALGATLLFLLTGKIPPIATEMSDAVVDALLPVATSANVRQAVKWAMKKEKAERCQHVTDFLDMLNGQMVDETTVTVKVQSKSAPAPEFVPDHIVDSQPIIDPVPDVAPEPAIAPVVPQKKSYLVWIVVGVMVVVGFVLGLLLLLLLNRGTDNEEQAVPEEVVVVEPTESVDAQAEQHRRELETALQDDLALADSYYQRANDLISQDKRAEASQVISDANYAYYILANGPYKELHGTNIGKSEDIDQLRLAEYAYWKAQLRTARNRAEKLTCYRCIYRLSADQSERQECLDKIHQLGG